jgi:hypothetical protein
MGNVAHYLLEEVTYEHWCYLGVLGACLATIPWWVWLVVILAGAVIGALTYFAGLLLAGGGAIVVNALLKAILFGALGGVLATFGYCLVGCVVSCQNL